MSNIPAVRASGVTTLGNAVKIRGQILGREDLTVDGDIEGSIDVRGHRLTIGPSANVRSNIQAREVIIFGQVHGNIDAPDRIEVHANASLVGDIRTAQVRIEDGSYFKGAVDIIRKPVAQPAANGG